MEDNREGGEAKVQRTVNDGHVNTGEEYNRLLEQEDPRSREVDLDLAKQSFARHRRIDLGYIHFASPF